MWILFYHRPTNDAHLDIILIKTRGFWSRGQDAYYDVRVFYPNASSYCSFSLNLLLNITRMLRSMNMVTELGILNMVFIPNGFSSTGGMGCKATVFYRCLTDLLATYWGQEYSQTIS